MAYFQVSGGFPHFIWPHMASSYFNSSLCCDAKEEIQFLVLGSVSGWVPRVTGRLAQFGSQVRRFDKRCISNVMMLNNLPLTITAQTLMVVSCVLCHCALTPSAGETRDRDLMYSAVGQVSRVKSTFTSPRWCICPSSQMSHLTLSLSNLSFSFSQVKLGCVCVCVWGTAGTLGSELQHIGEALIWCARRAAADSPSRDGAVFVLRVCKLAVIRLLSNDVGELIRAVLMGALISL